MPEMHFVVRWPEGDDLRCYSPSLVVRDYLEVGRDYPVDEFIARCRTLLDIASERVRARYGYACSAAMDQLAELEARAARSDGTASVRVTAFELPADPAAGAAARVPEPAATVAATDAVAPATEVRRG
jgi:uncharacterized repeat protein (TIGR04042 family)